MSCYEKKTEYEVLQYLGHGGYGQVSRVRRLSDGKILAMKKINYLSKMDVQIRHYMDNEVRLHSSLDHPFIVRMESWEDDEEEDCRLILMELCEGGDLFEYIEKYRLAKTLIPENDIWKIFAQLVDALEYCHDPEVRGNPDFPLPIIHRDFKPENVFLNKDQTEVRLGDFGFAKELVEGEDAFSLCGTADYMCPEIIIRREGYNDAADRYCLGATLYEMCTRDFLVYANGKEDVARAKVLAGIDPTIPEHYSPDLSELVRSLTLPNPLDRPTIAEMKNMSGYKWGKEAQRPTTDIENAEQKNKMDALRRAAVKAELKANTYQRRINDLELQLAQSKGDNVKRIAALDAREELLIQREERIKAEQEQLAIAQQSLQSREQQLFQEQVFFNKVHVLKREDLASREEKLAAREQLLSHLSQKLEAATLQSSPQSDPVGVVTSPTCINASDISKVGSTRSSKESASVLNEVPNQHVASPALRRVARKDNLRVNITSSRITAPCGIPIRTKHAFIPNHKIRSEGDLYAITLPSSAKSRIPISLSRIQRQRPTTAQGSLEAQPLKTKKIINEKRARPPKVSVAPSVCLLAIRTPRNYLRSTATKALKGAALRQLYLPHLLSLNIPERSTASPSTFKVTASGSSRIS